MRPIQPNDKRADFNSAPSSAAESSKSASKRKCVSSACIPCRKRKSKCDGGQPTCSTCTAVYKTACSYDSESDHRRKSGSKKEIATLTGEKDSLVTIINAIKSYPETKATNIVKEIRTNDNLDAIAENLRKNMTLPDISDISLTGERSDQFIGRAAFEGGTIRAYGVSSGLGLADEDETRPTQLHHTENWVLKTSDQSFVECLLRLYFSWVHPFYCLFSERLFWDDLRTGHCSSLLVNAILAVACCYCDREEARSDPFDHKTTGNHFFEEAEKILFKQRHAANLTTVQALALLALREASVGRPNSGFQYWGRCMNMVVELGLHISIAAETVELDPRDLEARKITFWACYNHDATWSVCIGRIAQLPRDAITVKKPMLEEYHDEQQWKPWCDDGAIIMMEATQSTSTLGLLHHYSALSDIVNDVIFMSYAPREPFTSVKVLEFYERYQRWFTNLPQEFQLQAVTTPHVLTLHMYYHMVVLNLFRPLLKFDIIDSNVSPLKVCLEMADSAAALVATYRSLYGLRRAPILLTHVIFTSTIIHLLPFTNNFAAPHLPESITSLRETARDASAASSLPESITSLRETTRNPSAASRLAESITSLHETTPNHNFSSRLLNVIDELVKRWNIQLRPDEEAALAGGLAEDSMILPSEELQYSLHPPNPPQSNAYHANVAAMPSLAGPLSYQPSGNFYWSPFNDGSVPLPSHIGVSQMDDSMGLPQPGDQWQHLDEYGFQVAAYDHRIPQRFLS